MIHFSYKKDDIIWNYLSCKTKRVCLFQVRILEKNIYSSFCKRIISFMQYYYNMAHNNKHIGKNFQEDPLDQWGRKMTTVG